MKFDYYYSEEFPKEVRIQVENEEEILFITLLLTVTTEIKSLKYFKDLVQMWKQDGIPQKIISKMNKMCEDLDDNDSRVDTVDKMYQDINPNYQPVNF